MILGEVTVKAIPLREAGIALSKCPVKTEVERDRRHLP
jgi:hypothetical protein